MATFGLENQVNSCWEWNIQLQLAVQYSPISFAECISSGVQNSSWDANQESVTLHSYTALIHSHGLCLHHSSSSLGNPLPDSPVRALWKESLGFVHQQYVGGVLPTSLHNQISIRGLQWKPEADFRIYTGTEVKKLKTWWRKSWFHWLQWEFHCWLQ